MEKFSVTTLKKRQAYTIWVVLFLIFGLTYAGGMIIFVWLNTDADGKAPTDINPATERSAFMKFVIISTDAIFSFLSFSQAFIGFFLDDDFHEIRVELKLVKGIHDENRKIRPNRGIFSFFCGKTKIQPTKEEEQQGRRTVDQQIEEKLNERQDSEQKILTECSIGLVAPHSL